MALVVKDRVRETTTTTGTGTVTLGGVGIGTYTSSGTTLSRDTILESSNSGSAVNFSAGTKDVFVTYPAEKAIYLGNLPTKMVVLKRDATTADVALANGFLPVLNRSGSTINVTVS